MDISWANLMPEVYRLNGIKEPDTHGNSDCPFCGGKKKFHRAKGRGVCRCAKCGEGGGTLWLHWKMNEGRISSTKEAARDLIEKMGLNSDERAEYIQAQLKKRIAVEKPEIDETQPIDKRIKAYNAMAGLLHLADDHKKELERRGLSPEFIEERRYRSLPVEEESRYRLARVLLSRGINVKGLPGFEQDEKGNFRLAKYTRGILLPVVNLQGNTIGYQIRKDNDKLKMEEKIMPDGHVELVPKNKFSTLSTTDRPGGGRMQSYCHFAGDFTYNEEIQQFIPVVKRKAIKVTEGPLKADIFYHLTGEPCLAVLGVMSQKHLKQTLIELKRLYPNIEYLEDCFDMDYITNPNVQGAIQKLKELCKEVGLKYRRLTWDAKYKGLDDFAVAIKLNH